MAARAFNNYERYANSHEGSVDGEEEHARPLGRHASRATAGTRTRKGSGKTRRSSSLYGSPTFTKVNLMGHLPGVFQRPSMVEENTGSDATADETQGGGAAALSMVAEGETSSQAASSAERKDRRELLAQVRQSANTGNAEEFEKHMTWREAVGLNENGEEEEDLGENEWKLGMPVPGRDGPMGTYLNRLGMIVNSRIVSALIIVCVIVNALVLGALTFSMRESTRDALNTADTVFLGIFTAEFVSQFLYLGLSIFQSGWLMFDGTIIVLSWAFSSSDNMALRSFRVFRLYAVALRWRPLRNLAIAIGRTVPRMAVIWVAIFVFFYTFCVFYTFLYSDLFDEGFLDFDYFGSLSRTFLTLFQFSTLDSWTGVVRQVNVARPWAYVGFVVWVIITAFLFFNLLIAVIVESLFEYQHIENSQKANKIMKQNEQLVSDQTEDLLRETRELARLQQEMLRNQLDMQAQLHELLTLVRGEEPKVRGKGRLKMELSGMDDLSGDEDNHSVDDKASQVPKRDLGAAALRRDMLPADPRLANGPSPESVSERTATTSVRPGPDTTPPMSNPNNGKGPMRCDGGMSPRMVSRSDGPSNPR